MDGDKIKAGSVMPTVQVINRDSDTGILLVCEHASNHIPARYGTLGLDPETAQSHIAWDPGALAVATRLSQHLNGVLIAGGVSRLLYDCNRPPEANDAIPARSEIFAVPGNQDLSDGEKSRRVQEYYEPFRRALSQATQPTPKVMITVHSFTPVYNGKKRSVQVGVLHDVDARLADNILELAPKHTNMDVQRNAPYGPEDGVTHTLKLHAIANGVPNVMLEIRNDLIATEQQQQQVAQMLAGLLNSAMEQL